jgi:hypothetical protein
MTNANKYETWTVKQLKKAIAANKEIMSAHPEQTAKRTEANDLMTIELKMRRVYTAYDRNGKARLVCIPNN